MWPLLAPLATDITDANCGRTMVSGNRCHYGPWWHHRPPRSTWPLQQSSPWTPTRPHVVEQIFGISMSFKCVRRHGYQLRPWLQLGPGSWPKSWSRWHNGLRWQHRPLKLSWHSPWVQTWPRLGCHFGPRWQARPLACSSMVSRAIDSYLDPGCSRAIAETCPLASAWSGHHHGTRCDSAGHSDFFGPSCRSSSGLRPQVFTCPLVVSGVRSNRYQPDPGCNRAMNKNTLKAD